MSAEVAELGGRPFCTLIGCGEEGDKHLVATKEQRDYEGFFTRPAGWPVLLDKFTTLSRRIDQGLAKEIAGAIRQLEDIPVGDLTALLGRVRLLEGADDGGAGL